jgi:nitroimidazol reductase NimA-like FMN-containing flavoprotein (pyridoxamine 5'-phosphate oxidase superfamily)
MPSRASDSPVFSALTVDECWAMLTRNNVGRIAFINDGIADIEPVHYVAGDPWLFARSAEGTKLEAFGHRPYVAFEVDEIDGVFDWRSVVAHGTVYLMSERGTRSDRAAFERALESLRAFIPGTLGKDDPTPLRRTIYGIHVDRLSGRYAVSTAAAAKRMHGRPSVPDGF